MTPGDSGQEPASHWPNSTVMPGDQDNKHVARFQDLLAKADHCERKAAAMTDPTLRKTYQELAQHWHEMAAMALRMRRFSRA